MAESTISIEDIVDVVEGVPIRAQRHRTYDANEMKEIIIAAIRAMDNRKEYTPQHRVIELSKTGSHWLPYESALEVIKQELSDE